jgi:hypothetical protein
MPETDRLNCENCNLRYKVYNDFRLQLVNGSTMEFGENLKQNLDGANAVAES